MNPSVIPPNQTDEILGNSGAVRSAPKFNLSEFLIKHGALISFCGTLLGIAGFFWLIHSELSSLNSRVGNVEGRIDVLLDERKELEQERNNLLENRIKSLENKNNSTKSGEIKN